MDIHVPDLGEGVTEAIVARWHRTAGESVRAGEVIVEVETEKTTTEVPAPASGVLSAILVEEGGMAAAGARLGVIDAA